jgi:hypothetical protein
MTKRAALFYKKIANVSRKLRTICARNSGQDTRHAVTLSGRRSALFAKSSTAYLVRICALDDLPADFCRLSSLGDV